MNYLRVLLSVFLLGGVIACTTKTEADPNLPVVSYESDIAPIVSANCTLNSNCHGGQLGYPDLSDWVSPGDPYNSEFYQVIRSYVPGTAMPPKPNAPLNDAQIGQIYVWILQGATEN